MDLQVGAGHETVIVEIRVAGKTNDVNPQKRSKSREVWNWM